MLKWKIGDVTVTRVQEVEVPIRVENLFPVADQAALNAFSWLAPHFVDEKGRLRLSIHALIVETPKHRILVDTCFGNDKERANGVGHKMTTRFLEELATAGFAPNSIDRVLCTHLHVDHVGWNTKLDAGKWVPTFPEARYLIARREFEYWRDQETHPDDRAIFADSVKPVFDAGLVDLVEPDHRIDDWVSFVPTPGHTPGHVSVRIVSNGAEALITGDMVHHPCQFARPDWFAYVDYSFDASTRMRRKVFAELAGRPVLVIGTHFAAPTAGHIKKDGEAYRLEV